MREIVNKINFSENGVKNLSDTDFLKKTSELKKN